MSNGPNLAASIRQRLLNLAKAQKRPFTEVLQYYAMERFLYRLSQSRHAESFILKGALMLRVWNAPAARPTMDIDMLGKTANNPQAIRDQVADILSTPVPADAMEFDAASITTEIIKEEADYQGVRVRVNAGLSGAKIVVQLDIGFGDALVPGPTRADFPCLLDLPVPNLLCYSRESAIAEKFEAMVKLGDLNSRMKDFYDIWLCARQFDFEASLLREAIAQTFRQRSTPLPDQLPFTESFVALKQQQWQAFHRRLNAPHIPQALGEIALVLREFLTPLIDNSTQPAADYWQAPGPWRSR